VSIAEQYFMQKYIFVLLFAVALLAPMFSFAETVGGVNIKQAPYTSVGAIINRITDVLFTILLSAAVIAILIAGFLFITAGGEPAKFQAAQKMILYAVIAIIVAVSAKAIVYFVENAISAGTSSAQGGNDSQEEDWWAEEQRQQEQTRPSYAPQPPGYIPEIDE